MVKRVETVENASHRAARIMDPFDVMRTIRVLAPHDPKLNDIRWLTGESLRRIHGRSVLNQLSSPYLSRVSGGQPPLSSALEISMHASEKLQICRERVGEHSWPILIRIVIEGGNVRDCRKYVPEVVTPWGCDAVVTDRLRVALDQISKILGITA